MSLGMGWYERYLYIMLIGKLVVIVFWKTMIQVLKMMKHVPLII